MTQYVLRAYCFGYNDENFYVCGTRISEVLDQRSEAEQAYRNAQLDYLRDIDLAEHEKFFNGDEAYVRKMDELIHSKAGKHIIGDDGWVDLGSDAHTELSDDDLFEFGEAGELYAYKLIAFDNEPVFHALWNPQEDKYFQAVDEGFEGLVYGASREELMNLVKGHEINLNWQEWERHGTLDDLSDNPTLLRQFIDTTNEIEYDDGAGVVRFGYPETEHVIAINALLREPIFEVRELSLGEIKDVEKSMGAYYAGEQKGFFDSFGLTLLRFLAWILVPIALLATARCTLGTCESFLGTIAGMAWVVFKWLAMIAVGLTIIIYGLYRIGSAGHKKKKRG